MPKINMKEIWSVTLYTGEKGPKECVCNCPLCSERARESSNYQGTELQINELFESYPSLEQLYILGNPDPAVDTDFCNFVARKATEKYIKVCFSVSGVGGAKMLQKLLKGIDTEMVDYISFSIDSIDKEKISMLKGIKYPFKSAIEGVKWAVRNGYIVKIQPTLWSSNYKEAGKIIEYFTQLGVNWFSFHIGSLEAGIDLPTHKHLQSFEVKNVLETIEQKVKKYPGLKVRCPIIYPYLGENDETKWYCMNSGKNKELLVRLTKKGIWCTGMPIASKFSENLSFMLDEPKDITDFKWKNYICPFSKQISGRDDTYCRFVSKTWNY